MNYSIYSFIIIALSCIGFAIAAFIHSKTKTQEVLVCPLDTDCDTVVHSRHARLLGVPVTVWGMIYYGITLLGSLFLLSVPMLQFPGIPFLLMVASMIAFFFSLYLTAIQAFVLRQWCSWCLVSAGTALLIFIIAILRLDGMLLVLLAHFRILMFMAYLFGLMMGVGGSIVYTVLFFKFLRDYRLSDVEKETLDGVAQVVTIGLGLVLVTGLGLFIPLAAWYTMNPEFMIALIAGAVLAIQTIMVKTDIVHRLSAVYESNIIPVDADHAYMRKLSYALGAVGLVSWITLAIVSFVNLNWSFIGLLSAYCIVVTIAVVWSQFAEYSLYKRSLEE